MALYNDIKFKRQIEEHKKHNKHILEDFNNKKATPL
jgi:hypothetical protein